MELTIKGNKTSYQEQIERLTRDPKFIQSEWNQGLGIFNFLGNCTISEDGKDRCGCPTMIRNNPDEFKVIIDMQVDKDLTAQVAIDERLPKNSSDIKPEHFPAFLEWRLKIDNLLKGE